jgi:hypothetical protein
VNLGKAHLLGPIALYLNNCTDINTCVDCTEEELFFHNFVIQQTCASTIFIPDADLYSDPW